MSTKINIYELYHYGVKGMRWGVRKEKKEQRKLRKAQKKWERNVNKNWHNAYNRAADTINSRIADFNKKYEKIDTVTDPKARRKYAEDYCNLWNDIYAKELDKTFGKAPIDNGRKWCETVPMFEDPYSLYLDLSR